MSTRFTVQTPRVGEEQPVTGELKPTPKEASSIPRSAGEVCDEREQFAHSLCWRERAGKSLGSTLPTCCQLCCYLAASGDDRVDEQVHGRSNVSSSEPQPKPKANAKFYCFSVVVLTVFLSLCLSFSCIFHSVSCFIDICSLHLPCLFYE